MHDIELDDLRDLRWHDEMLMKEVVTLNTVILCIIYKIPDEITNKSLWPLCTLSSSKYPSNFYLSRVIVLTIPDLLTHWLPTYLLINKIVLIETYLIN